MNIYMSMMSKFANIGEKIWIFFCEITQNGY